MKSCELRPLRVGKLLHDLLHRLLFDAFSKVGFLLARRGARLRIGLFNLPLNIRGAVEAFAGQGGVRENIVDAVIEPQGVLRRAAASVSAAASPRIDSGAEQDAVAVRGGRPDHAGIQHPPLTVLPRSSSSKTKAGSGVGEPSKASTWSHLGLLSSRISSRPRSIWASLLEVVSGDK